MLTIKHSKTVVGAIVRNKPVSISKKIYFMNPEEMHKVIKQTLREIFGDAADEIPALYGGSVNPGNACDLIVQPSIDGLFTGRAAWQADKFDTLIRDAIKAHDAK